MAERTAGQRHSRAAGVAGAAAAAEMREDVEEAETQEVAPSFVWQARGRGGCPWPQTAHMPVLDSAESGPSPAGCNW